MYSQCSLKFDPDHVHDVVLLSIDSTHIVWFPGEIGYYVHTYLYYIYLVYILND